MPLPIIDVDTHPDAPLLAREKGMQRSDPETHSFVIKLWLEETMAESGQATWRGRITHVSSGKQYYIKELSGIAITIAPYLEEMEVDLGTWWRLRQRVRRFYSDLTRRN